MRLLKHNLRTFVIMLIALIVVAFSGAAYSETKKAVKKPVAAATKEMPALTESYKSEILVSFYDYIKSISKDNEVIGALSDQSRDLFYNCIATRLTDTVWNSTAFKETRSFEAVNSNEVMKTNFEYCHLLATTKDALDQSESQKSEATKMSFNDLYVDYNNLIGKKIQVDGHFLIYGDMAALSQSATSATTLYADTSGLPRDDRKLLLVHCSEGCNVIIEGTVGNVQFQKGISATKLITLKLKSGGYFGAAPK